MLLTVLTLGMIVIGETAVIFAEQIAAKLFYANGEVVQAALAALLPALIGTVFLVGGYMLGLKHFQNIWIVSVVSLGAILIAEPLFNLFYIGQAPTLGALIGFALAIVAIGVALFIS